MGQYIVGDEVIAMAVFGLIAIPVLISIAIILVLTRPALEMLIARILRRPLLLIIRSDRVAEIKAAKYKHGLYVTNPAGVYVAAPNAALILKGAGTTIGVAFERYGSTIPRELMAYATEAKKAGIENLDEAENEGFEIEADGEVIRISDVIGFFKYNLNPQLLYAAVTQAAAAAKGKGMPIDLKVLIPLALIFLLIIMAMMYLQGGGSPPPTPQLPIGGG